MKTEINKTLRAVAIATSLGLAAPSACAPSDGGGSGDTDDGGTAPATSMDGGRTLDGTANGDDAQSEAARDAKGEASREGSAPPGPGNFTGKMLFDWNAPGDSNHTWTGWTWTANADGYGNHGWKRNDAIDYGGGGDWRSRCFIKDDTGDGSGLTDANIDPTERAPSTASGGSLKLTNPGTQNTPECNRNDWGVCTPNWWLNIPSNTMYRLGLADDSTNRFDYYAKYHGVQAGGGLPNGPINQATIQIGTYLFPDDNLNAGNEIWHYYHEYAPVDDVWMHVELDRHPQHSRGDTTTVPSNDPKAPLNPYYHNFSSIYHDTMNATGPVTVWLDEMRFWTQTEPENDDSIASVWVAYRPSDGHWLLYWNDSSFGGTHGDNSGSTFELRWSTSPIANASYSSAGPIAPLYNAAPGCTGCVWRPDTWSQTAYTEFQLPAGTEASNARLYFAIKDISSTGAHAGQYPHASGDGHNAPSSYIHTIDYSVRP